MNAFLWSAWTRNHYNSLQTREKESSLGRAGPSESITNTYAKAPAAFFYSLNLYAVGGMLMLVSIGQSSDWANHIKWLLEQYPKAEKIVMVLDNLNTHNISSLYEAFAPDVALRMAKRLEIHYTPKHGSWLDIAEIELSALGRQCLGKRRIDNLHELNHELGAWHSDRNQNQKGVDWQFSTGDARTKLKRLYPIIK